jgi:DNA-binding response OmpR family regulator
MAVERRVLRSREADVSATVTPLNTHTPLNILVVETEAVARCLIADALRQEGYRVIEASSGADARAVLARYPVHLVLIGDVPSGPVDTMVVFDLSQAMRPRPHVIVASTVVGRRPDVRGGLILAKPYVVPEVLEAVRTSFDHSMR